jgi:PAS domain S-box-containing protein
LSNTGLQAPESAEMVFDDCETLRRIVELAPTILYIYDVEADRNAWGNPQLIATLGYTREQMAGFGEGLLRSIFHPDDWPAFERHRLRLLDLGDGGVAELEYRLRRADGRWCWLRSRDVIFRRGPNGNVRLIVGSADDITRRREAEEALKESETRYRMLFEANPHPMFVTDLETLRFLAANDAAVAKYGYSRDEFLAMTIADIRPAEDVPRMLEAAERARTRGLERHGLWRHRLRNGDVIDVEITSHQLEFKGRSAVLVLANDVSLQLRAARELQLFSSVASHDLKEPLRGIGLLSKFMLDDEPSLTREGRKRLARMETLCNRLAEMIDGLLEYARSGGARRSEPCDLGELARAAADKLSETVGAAGVELSIAAHLPTIDGDPVLLERLFANLISNAIKHNTNPGKRIWIGQQGDAVYVKDNGPGIHPRDHERIFGLFNRLPGRAAMEGIGLGLPLVKKIVESHGGRIWVRSVPGDGTMFLMRFPGVLAT